jgi:hypothetical protein
MEGKNCSKQLQIAFKVKVNGCLVNGGLPNKYSVDTACYLKAQVSCQIFDSD